MCQNLLLLKPQRAAGPWGAAVMYMRRQGLLKRGTYGNAGRAAFLVVLAAAVVLSVLCSNSVDHARRQGAPGTPGGRSSSLLLPTALRRAEYAVY